MSRKPRNKIGATPAKLAVVGVLAIVLVGVLASNWTGAAAESAAPESSPEDADAEEVIAETMPKGAAATSPFGEFAVDEIWPNLPLTIATKFDPLATAAWAAPAPDIEAIAERQHGEEQLKELRNAQNAIIITSGERRMARIGEHEFQVGDVVGGFRITDISSAGVVLSEID